MKALCWYGTNDVRVAQVPEPKILNPRDAIVKVTLTAICGSDLHLLDGFIPTMKRGDILGHEFMGEVVDGRTRESPSSKSATASSSRSPSPAAGASSASGNCGRRATTRTPMPGWPTSSTASRSSGLFGYSHMMGGYAGGQAEYVRVPFADVGPIKVPPQLSDEQVLFLSDIFPTGYMAAENCNIQPGDTVAVWGCGPVGQFAIQSAWMLGAGRVIAIDREPERLRMAVEQGKAETIDFEEKDVFETLQGDDRRPRARRLHRRRRTRGARRPTSTTTTTRPRPRPSWRPTGSPPCARRSTRAAKAARCRSPGYTADSSTRCRSARRFTRA